MIYAGIGSRNTPAWVCEIFIRMGTWLAKRGDLLRSGHADGADISFEKGCDKVSGKKEIYLPWKGFQGSDSNLWKCSTEAYKLASKYHPAWDKCGEAAQKLMARNGYQVLGLSLEEPADFIVCWTPEGKLQGGTAQALRMAKDYQIPVFNAGNYENEKDLIDAFNTFYFSLEKQQELDR